MPCGEECQWNFCYDGVAMLAVIAFLYSAVTLGIRNRKRRWYWWDAKMLIAACTGMVYQVQFSQQSSNSITVHYWQETQIRSHGNLPVLV